MTREQTTRTWNFRDAQGGSALLVVAREGAATTGIHAIHEDSGVVEIQVAAAANPWAVNQHLVDYLSAVLGVAKHDIEILAGLHKPSKIISVAGLAPAVVAQRLAQAWAPSEP